MFSTQTITAYLFPYQASTDTYGLTMNGEHSLVVTDHDSVSYAELVQRVERDIRKRSPNASVRVMVGGRDQRQNMDAAIERDGAMPMFGVYL